MESYDIFCFIMGIGTGFIIAAISLGQKNQTTFEKKCPNEDKDKEKKDPANWWKYGGDPFNYD